MTPLSAFSDGRVLTPLDEARARAAYRNSGVEVLKLAAVGSDSCYILGGRFWRWGCPVMLGLLATQYRALPVTRRGCQYVDGGVLSSLLLNDAVVLSGVLVEMLDVVASAHDSCDDEDRRH